MLIETLFNVKGMSCGSCIRHIGAALGDIEGVENVQVKLAEGTVRVQHEPNVEPSLIAGAIEDAGYEAEVAR